MYKVKNASRVLIAAFVTLMGAGANLAADGIVQQAALDVHNVTYNTRLDALERDLASLQTQLAAQDADTVNAECCATSNWYAGVDIGILKPHLGAWSEAYFGGPAIQRTPEFDYAVAPRIWLAYDGPAGLGVRVAYWQIDTSTDPILIQGDADFYRQSGVEAHALDFDVTQRGSLGYLEFQLAGGVRYARLATNWNEVAVNDPFYESLDYSFEGVGPTLALDVRRPFGSRGLAFVGGARTSWLFGTSKAIEERWDFGAPYRYGIEVEDHLMQTWDAKVGMEWSRALGAINGQLTLRALWEAQSWAVGGSGIGGYYGWWPHQDIGFTGPTFSVEFRR